MANGYLPTMIPQYRKDSLAIFVLVIASASASKGHAPIAVS
ncbi:hypothetical protein B9479_005651, partial [Cryptococcus floricola]